MRLLGITVIKNEADIIEYALTKNSQWFDKIYVLDNGSDDGTWELVQEMSKTNPKVVPYLRSEAPFADRMRGEVFRAFSDQAKPGDWWCRLDGDEIYIDNPRDFLAKVPQHHHVVWSLHYQFRLVEEDLAMFEEPSTAELEIPKINESNRPQWYSIDASEPRFFRHRQSLSWAEEDAWPGRIGIVHPERIRLRHLQYRSPQQIELRLRTRQASMRSGGQEFVQWNSQSWRDKLADKDELMNESRDGLETAYDESKIPVHLEAPHKRLIKRLLSPLIYR